MDQSSARNTQSNKFKSKKRFSDEQIRSLESMFSAETRPESQTKQHIADQLGLDPHQVGIWFQNRRARCKSKQIEQDYRVLKARYDDLATRFEALKSDHHCLINELQRLQGSNRTAEVGLRTDLFVGEGGNLVKGWEDKDRNQAEVLNMLEPLCSSPLSSGNCHSLESILEPDYLLNHNSGSEWWSGEF